MITLNNVTLQRGNKELFHEASMVFYDRQKIGVVGKNGCGKTSLFLLLQGLIDARDGDVLLPSKLSIVSVEQEMPSSERSVLDYVIDADEVLRETEAALKLAEKEHDGHRVAELYEKLQQIDGFSATARAAKILNGLSFDDEMMQEPVNSLSGGWRMRLNLARALFVTSDLLLLDEPTNHLDLDSVVWVEKWLQNYNGLLLLISHDREFLDHITTHIVHIDQQQVKLYTGNFSTFEKERAEALALQQKHFEKQQKEIAHIESFIRRFKAKATKAKQAQSRVKALEKMQRIMPAHIDSPFNFEFKTPSDLANPLVTLERVSFAYETEFVLTDVDFQLNVQDRIGLLGRNGAGKSTLIKLLAGSVMPQQGMVFRHQKLNIGYFTQDSLDLLTEEKNALEHLKEIAEGRNELDLRKFLGGFDFSGDMTLMPVRNFSGGEKARLVLALIIWQAPNVLLLDEPTNHLDMDMRQALVLALQNFDGAVVVVSHDRFVLQQVVDEYYLIDNHHVKRFSNELEDYFEWLLKKERTTSSKRAQKILKSREQQKDHNRELKSLEADLASLQKELADFDAQLIELSENFSANKEDIARIQKRRIKIENRYKETEEAWLSIVDNIE